MAGCRVGATVLLGCALLACSTSPKSASSEAPPQSEEECAASAEQLFADCVELHERGDALVCPEGRPISVGREKRKVDCRQFLRDGDEAEAYPGWQQECELYRDSALSGCVNRLNERPEPPLPPQLSECSGRAAAEYDTCVEPRSLETARACEQVDVVTLPDGSTVRCTKYHRYIHMADEIGWQLECERKELVTLRGCAGDALRVAASGGNPVQCGEAMVLAYRACVARHEDATPPEQRYDDRDAGTKGWEGECRRQEWEVRNACMNEGSMDMASRRIYVPSTQRN